MVQTNLEESKRRFLSFASAFGLAQLARKILPERQIECHDTLITLIRLECEDLEQIFYFCLLFAYNLFTFCLLFVYKKFLLDETS